MKKIIKQYWIIVIIAIIVIFGFISFDIIFNSESVLEVQKQYMQEADSTELSNVANLYAQSIFQYKLYSSINIIILLFISILLSIQFMHNSKKEKINKYFFILLIVLFIIPYVINGIILLIAKLFIPINDYINFIEILKWIGINVILGLLIMSITIFIGCFTKSRIGNMLTTIVFLCVPVIIILLCDYLFQSVAYGYIGMSSESSNILGEWPILKMLSLFAYDYYKNTYLSNFGIVHIVLYGLISVGLLFLSCKLVNKEKKYNFISIVNILLFATLAIIVFIIAFTVAINIILATSISLIIFGVIYLITIMFLKNKNFKKLVIIYIIYSVIVLIIMFIVQISALKFETKVPNVDEVEYAIFSINNPLKNSENILYKDKENIQYIINKQQNIIENKNKEIDKDSAKKSYYIQYVLKNGKKITRVYLLEPEFEEIYDSDEYINQRYNYIVNKESNSKLTNISIFGINNIDGFGIELKQGEELYNEVVEALNADIKLNKAYRVIGDEYKAYSENENIRYLTVNIAIDENEIEEYLFYPLITDELELVKIVKRLIDEESDYIVWETYDEEDTIFDIIEMEE